MSCSFSTHKVSHIDYMVLPGLWARAESFSHCIPYYLCSATIKGRKRKNFGLNTKLDIIHLCEVRKSLKHGTGRWWHWLSWHCSPFLNIKIKCGHLSCIMGTNATEISVEWIKQRSEECPLQATLPI